MSLKGDLSENWGQFKESWENWVIATKLDAQPNRIVLATLKTIIGKESLDIVKNLTIEDPTNPDQIIQALQNHFDPQKNVTYERFIFNSAKQEDESIDSFVYIIVCVT